MEPGLKAFGQTGNIQISGAEERIAGFHPVEVGQEHVLGVLGAAVQFVDHLDRPRAEEHTVGKRAGGETIETQSRGGRSEERGVA